MSTVELVKFAAMLFIVGFIVNFVKSFAAERGADKFVAAIETVTP